MPGKDESYICALPGQLDVTVNVRASWNAQLARPASKTLGTWWSLSVALAAATAALSVAGGWWLRLIGMLFTVLAAIDFVFEYYRGHFAH